MSYRASEDASLAPADLGHLEFANEKNAYGSDLAAIHMLGPTTIGQVSWMGVSANNTTLANMISPQHWLFAPGTTATASFSIASTNTANTIAVADASIFQAGDYIMVRPRVSGVDDWTTVCHLEITSVSPTTIEAVRVANINAPTYGTWTVSGDQEIIVARHHPVWSNLPAGWSVNPSPIDLDGDGLANEGWREFANVVLTTWQTKFFEKAAAIQFDGGRWRFNRLAHPVDADNDLVADQSVIGGVNTFGLGGVLFSDELRYLFDTSAPIEEDGVMPSEVILVSESTLPDYGYRDYKGWDGIEIENFPGEDDKGLVNYSQGRLHLERWIDRVSTSTPLSFPFTKIETYRFPETSSTRCATAAADKDTSPGFDSSMFRVGYGTALLLGMPHPYRVETSANQQRCSSYFAWEDYEGGDLFDDDFLGDPVSAAKRHNNFSHTFALTLASSTWQESINSNAPVHSSTADGYDIAYTATVNSTGPLYEIHRLEILEVPETAIPRTAGSLEIFPSDLGAWLKTTIPSGDRFTSDEFTVSFVARGQNTYNNNSTYLAEPLFVDVPRNLRVRVQTADNNYDESVIVQTNKSGFSVGDVYTVSVRLSAPEEIKAIWFMSGEETGWIEIVDPVVYAGGSERWTRMFDGGAAIINVSNEDWYVELDPADGPYRRLDVPYDSTKHDEYSTPTGYTSPVHSGEPGWGPDLNRFWVPAQDALVVIRCDEHSLSAMDPCYTTSSGDAEDMHDAWGK